MTKMTEKEKLALIYRIISGYTIINGYIIDTATDSLLNESLDIYKQSIIKHRFEGLMTKEFAKNILIVKGLWSFTDDNNLIELDKSIDNCKLELYNNYTMPSSQVKQIRNRLETIKRIKAEKLNIKHFLDRYTIEGLADYNTEMYIFNKLVLNKDYKPIEVNGIVLERLITQYKLSWPSNSDLRLIARSEPWRSFWAIDQNCFRVLGDEQKALIMFSKMYDTVYEHPDRPEDMIINDDDALDGWFISMKRKHESEKVKNKQNALTNRHPRAQEIFVASVDKSGRPLSEQEAKEIAEMNDIRGKLVQKQISDLVQQKEVVRDMDIPSIRLEVANGQRKE